jgi:hypothetical protein
LFERCLPLVMFTRFDRIDVFVPQLAALERAIARLLQ